MSFIDSFIKAMAERGIKPLDEIKETNGKWKRARIEGDKGMEKTLAYRLTIQGDFSFGSYINHREGICHGWYSRRGTNKLTEEEKAAAKARTEAQKLADEQEREHAAQRAAQKAKRLWANANPDNHPYLEKKGIEKGVSRVQGHILYIPMYEGNDLQNLQCIAPDGTKRFLTGGKKQGMMCYLASSSDDKRTIVICEGYATGMSLRQTSGLPIVVAFDAGNLLPVAQRIRDKYPESSLIFAADNDHAREKGNIGIEKAQAALDKVGGLGRVIHPEFLSEHLAPSTEGKTYTDWNDYHQLYGPEATAKIWAEFIPPPIENLSPPATIPYDEEVPQEWEDALILKPGTSNPKPDSLENIILNFRYRDVYRGIFKFDEFANLIIVHTCPPWEKFDSFSPHILTERDITHAAASLERYGLSPDIGKIYRAIEVVAQENRLNPPKDYFSRLKWDGVKRIDRWLAYYCGCEWDNPDYLAAIGAKWLVAGIARVFNPGVKFDHMLVLEGPESAGKSFILQELATFNGKSYYTDAVKINRIDDKDSIIQLQGVMICEFAELAGLQKADMEELKRFITVKNDQIVRKYERQNTEYLRKFIMAGTLNPTHDGWLDDPTGGRRFWPALTGRKIDIPSLQRDKEQLWAEAVVRYKAGEELWLRDEVYELAARARDSRRSTDPWHEMIDFEFSLRNEFTSDDVFAYLKIDVPKRDRTASNRVGKILRRLGFTPIIKRAYGRSKRIWFKEGMEEKKPEESEAA